MMRFFLFILFFINSFLYSADLSKKFVKGLSLNSEEQVLSLVSLISKSSETKVSDKVIKLFTKNGVNPEFITYPQYNTFDYQSWYHAYKLKNLAKEITKSCTSNEEKVYKAFQFVVETIESIEPSKNEILWPYRILELKKGICDRQSWLLSELLYQLGFETLIVYLYDPIAKVSPHTICEIRKGKELWVIDPLSRFYLKETSIRDLIVEPELATKLWPNNKKWQQSIKNPICYIPSFPQDYCFRNQKLFKQLNYTPENEVPRFGVAPKKRLENYNQLSKNENYTLNYWFYPIGLFSNQIRPTK